MCEFWGSKFRSSGLCAKRFLPSESSSCLPVGSLKGPEGKTGQLDSNMNHVGPLNTSLQCDLLASMGEWHLILPGGSVPTWGLAMTRGRGRSDNVLVVCPNPKRPHRFIILVLRPHPPPTNENGAQWARIQRNRPTPIRLTTFLPGNHRTRVSPAKICCAHPRSHPWNRNESQRNSCVSSHQVPGWPVTQSKLLRKLCRKSYKQPRGW